MVLRRAGDRIGARFVEPDHLDLVCPVCEPHAAPGPLLPNPGQPRTVQRYLEVLPQHAPPARLDHLQPRHLWEVQSGKACGPDLRLPEADVWWISWYRHLTEADQVTLCAVMRNPPVCRTVGMCGRVTLLLKNPDQPIQVVNLRGITISSHISKLEPTAFYALARAMYERAPGGRCLVGGMRGVSL